MPNRDCPFCSPNQIPPKSKRVHKSCFLKKINIFRASKKIFSDFSVRMEKENEKTKASTRMIARENKNIDEFQEHIL